MGLFARTGLALAALGIATVVQAQTGTTTSTAAAATWTINVGRLDHKMEPDITTANIGDTILFQFYPQNHSVVRAA
jgi:plastocyanin